MLQMTKKASPISIWAAMISVYIVWGSTYLAIRFAVETIPPFLMIAFRFFIAGGILFLFRRLSGDQAPTRIEWRSAIVTGFFLLVAGNGVVAWAEQRVPSGIAALLVGASPLWMFLIDTFRPGHSTRRPGWLAFIGVLIGFVGIIVLIEPGSLGGVSAPVDRIGGLALLLASFCWSVGSLYSRHAPLPSSPLLGTSMEMLAGGAGLLILGTLTGEWSQLHLASIQLHSWLGLLYLIIFGSLVGFACYTWLLRSAPTTLVSTYAYVNPVVAILMGNLLAQEPLTPRVLIAAAIIIGSVVLLTFTQSARLKAQHAPSPALSPSED
jgi:drug/metabolite transporter (DMT)-like permease